MMKPPRALWVSFELGRPLGVPNDVLFQERVLMAVLKLLEAPSGPVLEYFSEDAPGSDDPVPTLACPVDFTQRDSDLTETAKLCTAFKKEMRSMLPWYERSLKSSGRTTVGVSGIGLGNIVDFICSFTEYDMPQSPRQDLSAGYVLNLAIDDLKAYYCEGLTSQPGQSSPSSQTVSDWFWGETIAAKALFRLAETLRKSEDGIMQIVGKVLIVPVDQKHRA